MSFNNIPYKETVKLLTSEKCEKLLCKQTIRRVFICTVSSWSHETAQGRSVYFY